MEKTETEPCTHVKHEHRQEKKESCAHEKNRRNHMHEEKERAPCTHERKSQAHKHHASRRNDEENRGGRDEERQRETKREKEL